MILCAFLIAFMVFSIRFIMKKYRQSKKRSYGIAAIIIVGLILLRIISAPAIESIESVNAATSGILGGMGPQAGLDFCNKLAKLNRGKLDQQYPMFLLYNKSNTPKRPENLKKYNNVLKALVDGCKMLQKINVSLLLFLVTLLIIGRMIYKKKLKFLC